MKLSTKIIFSYITAMVFPMIIIVGMIFGMIRYNLNSLKKEYDLDEVNYEMMLNPVSMLSHMNASSVRKLDALIADDPDKFTDENYLNEINDRLKKRLACIVVRIDGKTFYSGLPENSHYNDTFTYTPDSNNESVYVLGDYPYHVMQRNFVLSNGDAGNVQIYTDVQKFIPQVHRTYLYSLILAIIILFAGSASILYSLYRSILRPINKLKNSAESITAGKLNVPVTAESDDEIGELCMAFEAMRLKLKDQIEQNIQYEKDSKELISNISHDLKTPMTSIKGYIEGLMDGVADTPEKRERYLKTIYNKVNDMNSLIEELFLYAKLDSNSVTYSFIKLNVNAYFQDCADEISLDLQSQGVSFGYFNYADESTVVIADPEQLKRVINNIVGNSVKYASPDRPLSINIRISDEPEFIRVEIQDNGKGIARKELPYIFDRLYRTDASRNSSRGGSGLGLSIARKIIEEHGGKIWAESTEGVGTTMIFVLRKYREPEKTAGQEEISV